MAMEEVEGIILFQRKHREKDLLVKIFTQPFGKMMFFVRKGQHNPAFSNQDLMDFSMGRYIADIRPRGLSFLRSAKKIKHMKHIYGDIYKQAYATYVCNLADAALEDRMSHTALFSLLADALTTINEGLDAQIIGHIFELQIMQVFGVQQQWKGCVLCGKSQGRFDYSPRYHGILCDQHAYLDDHRYHADPKAIHFIRQLAHVDLKKLSKVDLAESTKAEIKKVIDLLYEENIGIHLKSKSFIDRLSHFENHKIEWKERPRQREDSDEAY